MLKNLFIILLTSLLALNIAACGESKEEQAKKKLLDNGSSNW